MRITKPDEKPPKRLPPKARKLALKLARQMTDERRAKEGLPPVDWNKKPETL